MDEMLMSLFNPRGDGTLRPGDLMYDVVTGTGLVLATNIGDGWKLTEYAGTTS